MSITLENLRLFDETQRLLKETERRATELAIINSVQEGLAASLTSNEGIQAMYDLVGDKIRDFFNAQTIMFAIYDFATQARQLKYHFEKGQRFYSEPAPLSELHKALIRNGKTLVFNENMVEELMKLGSIVTPGSEAARSAVFVPLTIGNRVFGAISLQNIDNEHAFPEADVRLLETLAASIGVALENTRLFDETQRLLQETERRATELASINSVQEGLAEGLASKSDIQAFYDLVGDRIRDLLNVQATWIITFDRAAQVRHVKYGFQDGQRFHSDELLPYNKLTYHLLETKKVLVINQNFAEARTSFEMAFVEGAKIPKSAVYVPLVAGVSRKMPFRRRMSICCPRLPPR
jgi:GAF domain-containing protein